MVSVNLYPVDFLLRAVVSLLCCDVFRVPDPGLSGPEFSTESVKDVPRVDRPCVRGRVLFLLLVWKEHPIVVSSVVPSRLS